MDVEKWHTWGSEHMDQKTICLHKEVCELLAPAVKAQRTSYEVLVDAIIKALFADLFTDDMPATRAVLQKTVDE